MLMRLEMHYTLNAMRFRIFHENSYNMFIKKDRFSGKDKFYKNIAFKIYPKPLIN